HIQSKEVFSSRLIHERNILLQWLEESLDLPADRHGGLYPATLGIQHIPLFGILDGANTLACGWRSMEGK
ncbi:hypothetical protein CY34DRAFT_441461, partial [Suillus luteus UH-Slu-Lm8-n1]